MPSGWTRSLLPAALCGAVLASGGVAYADPVVGVPVSQTVLPAAPGSLVVTPGPGRLDVAWAAPEQDGGSLVTEYEVTATAPGEPVAAVVAQWTAAAVEGLKDGVTYAVSVVALNASGPGPAATAGGTPRSAPAAPVITAVAARDAAATVTWKAPADGGSPITGYVVTASPGGSFARVAGTATSATVGGLANGTPHTFTVTAVNAAGPGVPSAPSGPVVPRLRATITVTSAPVAVIRYGTPSNVRATVTNAAGAPVSGQLVELWGRVHPATTYARLAAGTTDAAGAIALTTTLRANAALLLRHPPGRYAAADAPVRGVAVAPRVTAGPTSAQTLLGRTVTVRGNVAPRQPVGAVMRLQRYSATGWLTVASGKTTSPTEYQVTWRPERTGWYRLRVIRPAGAGRALGRSAGWMQRVRTENARDLARAIAADGGIDLDTRHLSGVRDNATAMHNIADVAAGRLAQRSAYENAPGGYTTLDLRLLKALRRMGLRGSVTVSEIAGGSHSRGSTHYYGRGLDIRSVNGVPVGRSTSYRMAVDACRAYGAVRVFYPAYDPYGGHQGHVHCDW